MKDATIKNNVQVDTRDSSRCRPTTCSPSASLSALERVNESPYALRYRESSHVVMWLNLIWLDKSLARSPDQQARVSLPLLRQDVYDKLVSDLGLLGKVKEKLQQLYPYSFLFRLAPEQVEVVDRAPLPVSPSHFEEMCRQILCVRSQDEIAKGTSLAVTAHKIWLQTQGHSLSNTTNWDLEHDYDRFRKESALKDGSIFLENVKGDSRLKAVESTALLSLGWSVFKKCQFDSIPWVVDPIRDELSRFRLSDSASKVFQTILEQESENQSCSPEDALKIQNYFSEGFLGFGFLPSSNNFHLGEHYQSQEGRWNEGIAKPIPNASQGWTANLEQETDHGQDLQLELNPFQSHLASNLESSTKTQYQGESFHTNQCIDETEQIRHNMKTKTDQNDPSSVQSQTHLQNQQNEDRADRTEADSESVEGVNSRSFSCDNVKGQTSTTESAVGSGQKSSKLNEDDFSQRVVDCSAPTCSPIVSTAPERTTRLDGSGEDHPMSGYLREPWKDSSGRTLRQIMSEPPSSDWLDNGASQKSKNTNPDSNA